MSQETLINTEQRDQAGVDSQQYLTFRINSEMYAIGILHIKEIIRYGLVTAVPMMPGFVRGVINLRGEVVPVIDLKSRFGGETTPITSRTCIVIVEAKVSGNQQIMGAMVESVSAVVDIPGEDIRPTPNLGTNIRADFISGMGKVNDSFVIILNSDAVLSDDILGNITRLTNEMAHSV